MASSRCGKCGGNSFELSDSRIPGALPTAAILQCANASCGTVVGVTEREPVPTLEASRKDQFERAFVVSEEDLRKLHSAITDFAGAPSYRVLCSNQLQWANYGIEDLLKMENHPESEITGLQIEAHANNPHRAMFLALLSEGEKHEKKSGEEEGPNVWVTIEGPSQAVIELNQQINNRLTAMSPWYGWLTSRAKWNLIGLIGAITGAVFVLSKVLYKLQWPESKDTRSLIYVGVWILFAILIAKLQKKIFPVASFLIGQGIKGQKTREMIQQSVVISFVVSIVAEVILWLVL